MGIGNAQDPITWEDFENSVWGDIKEIEEKQQADTGGSTCSTSACIYRGQANADWALETTLDRYLEQIKPSEDNHRLKCHYGLLRGIIPAINSLTSYEFPEFELKELKLDQDKCPDHYELLSFARHLGFPNPLLDWTCSHYVAAFFAFKDAKPQHDVAIYAFQSCAGNGQIQTGANTWINHCGPIVRSHHRHYRQRGTYTLCTAKEDDNILLGSYKQAFKQNPESYGIRKIKILGSEKEKVLSRLFSMNINDYTLFGDEESLMRMLAYKEFRKIR